MKSCGPFTMDTGAFTGAFGAIRAIIKSLLLDNIHSPRDGAWSIQGLGMLRCYFGEGEYRLHIWDQELATYNVSDMHDHPWDFESLVIAGSVTNTRFARVAGTGGEGYLNVNAQKLRCGEGGHLEGEPFQQCLLPGTPEVYRTGDAYSQAAREIHVSQPTRGAVTLIRRTPMEDPDCATVFWPIGTEWVSAEPGPAPADLVQRMCQLALDNWEA